MLKEVSCTPSTSPDCGSPVETKTGTPHFFINATFNITWTPTLEDPSESKVASILFIAEQHALLEDYSTISYLLNSSVGLPLQDCAAIADHILSCARHLSQGDTPEECLWMKLCVSCHLENPDEVKTVRDARNRTFDSMALKHVKVEQGGGAEVEVEVDEIPTKRCSICLEDMVAGTQVTRIPCSHIFHNSCIMRWLERGANCPECRYDPIISTFGENNKLISHVFPDN